MLVQSMWPSGQECWTQSRWSCHDILTVWVWIQIRKDQDLTLVIRYLNWFLLFATLNNRLIDFISKGFITIAGTWGNNSNIQSLLVIYFVTTLIFHLLTAPYWYWDNVVFSLNFTSYINVFIIKNLKYNGNSQNIVWHGDRNLPVLNCI